MEDRRLPQPSLHLPSRLDHLDLIMKYLEGKLNLQKGTTGKGCVPFDFAMREAYFKGPVLDRVTALERRLSQLCLELENSNNSCPSTSTSGYASSSQGSKGELPLPLASSFTFPTFSKPNQGNKQEIQPLMSEIQEKPQQEQQKKKISHLVNAKKQKGKKRSSKGEKACKSSGKKKVAPKWPHLRLFGC